MKLPGEDQLIAGAGVPGASPRAVSDRTWSQELEHRRTAARPPWTGKFGPPGVERLSERRDGVRRPIGLALPVAIP